MANEMTVEEAVRIVSETFDFGEKFDAAVSYLKANDPENSALAPIKDKDIADVKKARAKDYLQKAIGEDEYDGDFSAALQLLKGDKKVQQEVKEAVETFDAENHMNMTDEEAVLRNADKIGSIIDDVNYETVMNNEEFSDMAKVINKIDLVETDKDGNEQAVAEDKIADYWTVAIENAKQQAMMLRAGDLNFFMKKNEDKKEVLNRDIKNFFAMDVAQGVSATAMTPPTEKEAVAGSEENKAYLQRESAKAERTLNDMMTGNKRVKLNTDNIIIKAVETSKNMASYVSRWAQKGFNRVAEFFGKRKENFDNLASKTFGIAKEAKEQTVEYAKNNKWRLIADTAATGIVAVTAATGVGALPAVAGYALYTAAGSWSWPLLEKKTKEIRKAKAAGTDTKDWEGIAGIEKAFREIKADKNAYKQYKNRAYTGTAFGVAGAGLVAGMGAASGWMVDKAGYLTAKVASSVIRSMGSVTSQFLNYKDTKADFKADPSAENRARLKQAKWGLGIGAALAVAGNWLGFNRLAETNSGGENAGGFMDRIRGIFGKGNEDAAAAGATAGVVTTGVADATDGVTDATTNAVSAVEVPVEYSDDMGISANHWNEMHKKIVGLYENNASILGLENVNKEDAWQNMYQNIANAKAANPDMFGDQTTEQVLYKYMKLIENCEQGKYVVGEDGHQYVVTKLAKDGLPVYTNKEMTEVIRGLNDVIICGKTTDVSADRIGTVLGYINESKGTYEGPGAGVGVTHNVYVGGRAECGDGYQNVWRRGAARIVAPVNHPVEQAVTPVDDVVQNQPQEAKVDDVVQNQEVAQKPAQIDDVVQNEARNPARGRLIEGATDGNLDVNNPKLEGRTRNLGNINIPTSGGRE